MYQHPYYPSDRLMNWRETGIITIHERFVCIVIVSSANLEMLVHYYYSIQREHRKEVKGYHHQQATNAYVSLYSDSLQPQWVHCEVQFLQAQVLYWLA